LTVIGNIRGFATFVPHQDKNKLFVSRRLGELRLLQKIPPFSYDVFVKKAGTIDVTWFNQRQMPNSFFEVEHSTDIRNSLLKFHYLQDFHVHMVIVADDNRHAEFEHCTAHGAFKEIKGRVNFLGYDKLGKIYEYEVLKLQGDFSL